MASRGCPRLRWCGSCASSPTNKDPGYGAFPPDSVQLRYTLLGRWSSDCFVLFFFPLQHVRVLFVIWNLPRLGIFFIFICFYSFCSSHSLGWRVFCALVTGTLAFDLPTLLDLFAIFFRFVFSVSQSCDHIIWYLSRMKGEESGRTLGVPLMLGRIVRFMWRQQQHELGHGLSSSGRLRRTVGHKRQFSLGDIQSPTIVRKSPLKNLRDIPLPWHVDVRCCAGSVPLQITHLGYTVLTRQHERLTPTKSEIQPGRKNLDHRFGNRFVCARCDCFYQNRSLDAV